MNGFLIRIHLADLDGKMGRGFYADFRVGNADSSYKLSLRHFFPNNAPFEK